MEKETIKNRKGVNLVVQIEDTENPKGLVFVMHGLGHTKEMPWLNVISDVFQENNFIVVRFDATNSVGESGGKLEDATPTNYYHDLVDVITWAKSKDWYQEPFYLVGHSLGGFCSAFYASKSPKEVKGLILLSSFISGKLSSQSPETKPLLKDWKEKGYREWESSSTPGLVKRLKWSYREDSYKYDLLKVADKIACPVLMIAGEKDEIIPPEHQKLFFNKLNSDKKMYVLEDSGHTFMENRELKELEDIIKKWI